MYLRPSLIFGLLMALCGMVFGQERLLAPGVSLKITCDEVPDLCIVRTIEATGTIALPGFGDVPAIDMPLSRLQQRLVALVSFRFGHRIGVTTELAGRVGDGVRVEGLIKASFSRKWSRSLTMRSLLADVPLLDNADVSHVTVFRGSAGKWKIDVSLDDFSLRPGDIVEVGARQSEDFVVIVGPVLKPGTVLARSGMTLSEAIQGAGGLTGHGDPSNISLRHTDGTVEVLDLKKRGAILVRPGDWISVGLSQVRQFVSVLGPVPRSGLIEFKDGMTLTDAIRSAGADPAKLGDNVTITHVLGKLTRPIKFHLVRILAKIEPDPVLMASDSVVLEERRR